MKCEPSAFTIDDLERDGVTSWEGVRNYQARNFMRDGMQVGDGILFYHSNTKVPGIVGLATVASTASDYTLTLGVSRRDGGLDGGEELGTVVLTALDLGNTDCTFTAHLIASERDAVGGIGTP